MITQKHIIDAQAVVRKIESTPIIVNPDNSIRVTYDHATYNKLLGVLVAVADSSLDARATFPTDYHREKI